MTTKNMPTNPEMASSLDDAQLRAVADSGGTVGVIYDSRFLGDGWLRGRAERIVDHLAHIVRVAGEDTASLGSDWDGAMVPPRDMATCLELPRLVDLMLKRGWPSERIRKILGQNFLRALGDLRGHSSSPPNSSSAPSSITTAVSEA